MTATARDDFDRRYQSHLKHLKLQGLQPKTIEAYARAVRRIGEYFDRQIDDLSEAQLTDYFSDLIETHSWSAVKLDLYGYKFYVTHVLRRPWSMPNLIKPPKAQRLPDIVTVDEAQRLFAATRILSYRVFFFTLYSLGLRLGEGLALTVADIDAQRRRVHVRDAKGNKDRFVPLPQTTLSVLRRFWLTHRNASLLFPSRLKGLRGAACAVTALDRGTIQAALRRVVGEFGAHHRALHPPDHPDPRASRRPHRSLDGALHHRLGDGEVITLASLIERFETACLAQYRHALLPSHLQALQAMKRCRTSMAPRMLAHCSGCDQQLLVPHSCGHRSCPHCQHFESQRWLERQTQRLVAGSYFLVTFTLPAELRPLAWQHQRIVYDLLMDCAWQTLRTFSQNHRHLRGSPGAIAVLHTNARDLHFHPHVHLVIPGAALDVDKRLWRTLPGAGKYLFDHKALAKVFRAKLLCALHEHGLLAPAVPMKWVVDCQCVGDGRKALAYLGRYLYRGVIQEHDIIGCDGVNVTYRWRDGRTGQTMVRTVSGATFLWLVVRHVLPRGFRRSRNHGFLHPNSKRLIALLRLLVFRQPTAPPQPAQRPKLVCRCCGQPMIILRRRIQPTHGAPPSAVEDTKNLSR